MDAGVAPCRQYHIDQSRPGLPKAYLLGSRGRARRKWERKGLSNSSRASPPPPRLPSPRLEMARPSSGDPALFCLPFCKPSANLVSTPLTPFPSTTYLDPLPGRQASQPGHQTSPPSVPSASTPTSPITMAGIPPDQNQNHRPSHHPLLASYYSPDHPESLPAPVHRCLQTAQLTAHSLDELVRLRAASARHHRLAPAALLRVDAVIKKSEAALADVARLMDEVQPRGDMAAWQRRVEWLVVDMEGFVGLEGRVKAGCEEVLGVLRGLRSGAGVGGRGVEWVGVGVLGEMMGGSGGRARAEGEVGGPGVGFASPLFEAGPVVLTVSTAVGGGVDDGGLRQPARASTTFEAAGMAAMFDTVMTPPPAQPKVYKAWHPSLAQASTSKASAPHPSPPLASPASLSRTSAPISSTPSPKQQPPPLYQQQSPPALTIPRKPHASVDLSNIKPLSTIPQDLIHRYDLYDAPKMALSVAPVAPAPVSLPPAPYSANTTSHTASGPGYTSANTAAGQVSAPGASSERPAPKPFPFMGHLNKLRKRSASKERKPMTAVVPATVAESPMVFPVHAETRGNLAEVFGKDDWRSTGSWYALGKVSSAGGYGAYEMGEGEGGKHTGVGELESKVLVVGPHELDAVVSAGEPVELPG